MTAHVYWKRSDRPVKRSRGAPIRRLFRGRAYVQSALDLGVGEPEAHYPLEMANGDVVKRPVVWLTDRERTQVAALTVFRFRQATR